MLNRFLCEAKIVLVNEIVVFDGLNFILNEVILKYVSNSHNSQYTTIPNHLIKYRTKCLGIQRISFQAFQMLVEV